MVFMPYKFIPLPLPAPLPIPGGGLDPSSLPAASAYACSLLGFLIVLSTARIAQAASQAAYSTLILTYSGSHTNFKYRSSIFPSSTFTPYQIPSAPPWACFYLSLFNTSVESIPEFSDKVLGIVSRAFAKPLITNYIFPGMSLKYSLKYLDNSISIAPPPATIA